MSIECPLCKTIVQELKSNSHVLPKFFLKPIRNIHGQIQTVNVFKSIIDPKSQDLPKGTYICSNCETKTATLDGYGANVLNQNTSANISSSTFQQGQVIFEHWQGINLEEFRDFLLSILLRDHCWRKSENIPTIMQDTEFEDMRKYYLQSPQGDNTTYPIVMHRIQPLPLVPNLHKTTSPPTISSLGDAVTFMGLGFAVMVYFRPITDFNMIFFVSTFGLQQNGSIKMPHANLLNVGTFKKSQQAIKNAYNKYLKKKDK